MAWEWLILPVIGAFIGWVTNRIAIRLLFRPKEPIRLLGTSLQGFLPRRKDDLAQAVADTVEKDLLTVDEILEKVDVSRYEKDVVEAVVVYVDRRIHEQLPSVIPANVRNAVTGYVRRVVSREAGSLVRDVSGTLSSRLREELSVGSLVREKIQALETDQLERLVMQVARAELRAIEWFGGLLGGVIGLFQAALVTAF